MPINPSATVRRLLSAGLSPRPPSWSSSAWNTEPGKSLSDGDGAAVAAAGSTCGVGCSATGAGSASVACAGSAVDGASSGGGVLSPNSSDLPEVEQADLQQDVKHWAMDAIAPVVILIVAVMAGLYVTGEGDSLQEIIGSSDAYKALMWGSLLGVVSAIMLTLYRKTMTLEQTIEAWGNGVRLMLSAFVILILAWSLAEVTAQLHTADYLISWLSDKLSPGLVPAVAFLMAAATAFATGTSWGTMAIMTPIFLPLTWAILLAHGQTDIGHYYVLYSTVACILSGAVWGDHCSPISDTTILSSMAAGCNHIDHVLTQIPYALIVGLVAILFGTLPAGFGFPWWGSLIISTIILCLILRLFGKKVEN